MSRNYSNVKCTNCKANGHSKKACPLLLETVHLGTLSICNDGPAKKEVVNNSSPICYLGGSSLIFESEPLSNIGTLSLNFETKHAKEQKPPNSKKNTDGPSKKEDYKILILRDQDPALAHLHECDLCDEYGHYEYECELYLKAKKEQEEYGQNWLKRWGKKVMENRKHLKSISNPNESGMQCQYCYSIHHKTEFCFLKSYGIREQLNI